MNEYLIELLAEAIYYDICKDTSEWADPTGERACSIYEAQKLHTL